MKCPSRTHSCNIQGPEPIILLFSSVIIAAEGIAKKLKNGENGFLRLISKIVSLYALKPST